MQWRPLRNVLFAEGACDLHLAGVKVDADGVGMRQGPGQAERAGVLNGRRFRVLNVVDDVTHECLAAIPDISISGRRVARELTALIEQRGRKGMIVSDNGT